MLFKNWLEKWEELQTNCTNNKIRILTFVRNENGNLIRISKKEAENLVVEKWEAEIYYDNRILLLLKKVS